MIGVSAGAITGVAAGGYGIARRDVIVEGLEALGIL